MGKMDEAEAKVGEFATVSEKSSARFGKAMSKMGTAVIGASAVIAGYGLKAAYEYGKAIEKIGFQSGASEKEVDRLKKHILDLSVATATSATEIAGAYVLIEQAGFRRAKADAIATNAAKLAKLTNTDLATATKDLIAVQALHLNGSKSAAETTAMLVELNRNHVGTLEDLSNLFGGKLSATMKTFGISTASAAAGIEAITKHGIAANVASQGLTVGMTKLLTPSAKIDKSLHAIGLSQRRIADDLHKPNGLFVALSDLKTHLVAAGVPAKDFGGYISSLAGARGAAGLGVMMQYLDDMKKSYPDLLNSQKKFDEAWAAFQKTPEFKFDKLKSDFNKAMIQVGNIILPVAIDVADAILKAQKWLSDPKHKIYAHILADVAIGVVATAIISKITTAFKNWTNTGIEAKMLSQGVTEIALLKNIDINTAKTAGLTPLGGGGGGGKPTPTPGSPGGTGLLSEVTLLGGTVFFGPDVIKPGLNAAKNIMPYVKAVQDLKGGNNLGLTTGQVNTLLKLDSSKSEQSKNFVTRANDFINVLGQFAYDNANKMQGKTTFTLTLKP
jgi:TP901 family phage tail tape measure protein